MSGQRTFAEITATLRDLTAKLKQEDRAAIRAGWETLGSVDHRATLLTLRCTDVSIEEARGLVYAAMDTAPTDGDYTENILQEAEKLVPQLSDRAFRDKILGLAGQSKQFDRVAAMASTMFRGVV